MRITDSKGRKQDCHSRRRAGRDCPSRVPVTQPAATRPGIPTTWLSLPSARTSKGQGTGTALLHAHHAALDRKGMPAYLEASGRDTCRVYLGHGYLLRPDAPIRLPDGGPEMFPMWREPRRPGHA